MQGRSGVAYCWCGGRNKQQGEYKQHDVNEGGVLAKGSGWYMGQPGDAE
jgi:hypothetical protein